MEKVGIRALKQNASAVVAQATAGETIIITDRGRPVAQLSALPKGPLQALLDSGRARPAKHDFCDFPDPEPGPNLSEELIRMREDERY